MRFLRNLPFIGLGLMMILHGFAHLPAVFGSWKLATFEDISYQPNIIFSNAGDTLVQVLGFIWLAAAIAFVVAGIGVLRRAQWWAGATLIALAFSMPMTVLWIEDAVIGMVLNLAILLGILAWVLITSGETRKLA
jgi:hypothetical protein